MIYFEGHRPIHKKGSRIGVGERQTDRQTETDRQRQTDRQSNTDMREEREREMWSDFRRGKSQTDIDRDRNKQSNTDIRERCGEILGEEKPDRQTERERGGEVGGGQKTRHCLLALCDVEVTT